VKLESLVKPLLTKHAVGWTLLSQSFYLFNLEGFREPKLFCPVPLTVLQTYQFLDSIQGMTLFEHMSYLRALLPIQLRMMNFYFSQHAFNLTSLNNFYWLRSFDFLLDLDLKLMVLCQASLLVWFIFIFGKETDRSFASNLFLLLWRSFRNYFRPGLCPENACQAADFKLDWALVEFDTFGMCRRTWKITQGDGWLS